MNFHTCSMQHTFITFVGGKLLGPTFLGFPTVRTVGVGVTSLFCCENFVGPTDFGSPAVKTVDHDMTIDQPMKKI